jgi:CheY-like chemotaxis protein
VTTQKRIKLQIELVAHEGLCDDPVGRRLPVYRHLITDYLHEWNFDFLCAKDGRAAWGLLTKPDSPRLVLLDWVLPGLDGVELCRWLRHRPETEPCTHTILLTAKSQKHEMLEAMHAGADDDITSSQFHQRVDFECADTDSCQANNGQHGDCSRGVGY